MSEELSKDYRIGDEIGRGRFGVVYRCYSPDSGEIYAVKSIDKSVLADDFDFECAVREAKILRLASAGNPHVVQIHAVYEDEAAIHLVMDLCEGGDLFDRIAACDGAPMMEADAVVVMAALMEALAICHRRGVAHRDVKPDNVLFDGEGRLRLADFGSADCFGDGRPMMGLVGTPYYVAPEVVAGKDYGEKVDVWSAGVVLYIMLGGIPPFYGETATEIFEAVMRGNLRFPTRVFGGVSPLAKDLIRRMLCKDVSRRFSAEQVLRHPWITSGVETRCVADQT
ncbi:phosphoenolpyruvate carboxylase kinase 1-like [Phalaenopsis equestris]|uniref:phosphoenolpyruvate carboxylase kinase 1-like n=1 Tax=Phalaenopsis equestris TaxID=78828 RepID=UPI0009E3EAA6|nr:phosphoenolpyruvate carboxylase kinase 1-like [Phalaenopsis equestris]